MSRYCKSSPLVPITDLVTLKPVGRQLAAGSYLLAVCLLQHLVIGISP